MRPDRRPARQMTLPYTVETAGAAFAVRLVRHPRARYYRLRVEPDGSLRVTIPRGGSRRAAERFAEEQAAWVRQERARLLARPTLDATARARLRQQAAHVLPARVAELAAHFDLRPTRVSVGDQRTRWGSCSGTGAIRLNWRLVLMPPWVRDYVIVHELMHLRRLDHGPAFWRLVEAACPSWRDARRWLRRVSPARLEAAGTAGDEGDDAAGRCV